MENASKALLIAGEVLIGIIVLSIFAYTFQKVYTLVESYQERSEHQKIIEFNTQFTKYATGAGKYIYTEDIVTITEQVLNYNQITVIDSEKIELNIVDENLKNLYSTKTQSTKPFDRTTFLEDYKLRGDPSHANEKEYRFKCMVKMDSTTSMVNEITIRRFEGE